MKIQIGNYEVDSIILDMGSYVNILKKLTWKNMGRPTLGWSPMQLRLANQAKVQPIEHISHLVVDVEGMKTYVDFDVIEVLDGEGSYPAFFWTIWANDSMAVIKFKKRMMTFENQDIRVIAPMEPSEGRRYIDPVKYEVFKGRDHSYNISEDYIHPNANREHGWHSASSSYLDSDDTLEN